MSTATDPTWTLALWIILGTFTLACLAFLAIERQREHNAQIDRWTEPTDMTWTDEALGRVLADIDALPPKEKK